ncbi:hypothetical protein BOTBODRAFT_48757 [Botryobasidium botryosum FD-172 SS1]|uniref:Dicer dsRNA-binding fold domain-containing protein n=1 Tax=Botryobasidium botryosum (strain FD-172 SS1) TaxID=930990 RepID=A0A067LWB4_BOTB1|nr:hypothetical protein BOTBODRAFT_48757 [Botryobasidium botryosum FD-172 SS1]
MLPVLRETWTITAIDGNIEQHLTGMNSSSAPRYSLRSRNRANPSPSGANTAARESPKRQKVATASAADGRFIQDPTTGSRVYTQDAIGVVQKYCASLDTQPTFALSSRSVGGPRLTAEDARHDAAFEACVYLHNAGLLEYNHFPHQTTTLAALSRENKAGLDNPQRQPTFYKLVRDTPTDRLFATVFRVVDGDRSCRPFACLTSHPFPSMAPFWITHNNLRFQIETRRSTAFQTTFLRRAQIFKYNVQLLRLMSRDKSFTPDKLNYVFVPLSATWNPSGSYVSQSVPLDVEGLILWDEMKRAFSGWARDAKETKTDIIQNARDTLFHVGKGNDEFAPLHQLIRTIPRSQLPAEFKESAKGSKKQHPLYVEGRRFEAFGAGTGALLYTPLKSCTTAAFLFAPIMKYLDEALNIKELNWRVFEGAIGGEFMRHALSTAFSSEGQRFEFFGKHDLEPAPYNKELMRFTGGDTITNLHMGLSLAVTEPPTSSLHQLHSKLSQLQMNSTFTTSALLCHLPEWVFDNPQTHPTNADLIPTSITNRRKPRTLSKKGVADVVESLVAAGYFSGGHVLAFRTQKILKIPIPEIVSSWDSLAAMAHLALPPQDTPDDGCAADAVAYLEGILGIKLRIPHLVRRALLSFYTVVSTRYLARFSGAPNPAKLTRLMGSIQNRKTLAALSVNAHLHDHIFTDEADEDERDEYIVAMQISQAQALEEAERQGRRPRMYWESENLHNTFEPVRPLFGALAISEGLSLDAAAGFFDREVVPFFNTFLAP